MAKVMSNFLNASSNVPFHLTWHTVPYEDAHTLFPFGFCDIVHCPFLVFFFSLYWLPLSLFPLVSFTVFCFIPFCVTFSNVLILISVFPLYPSQRKLSKWLKLVSSSIPLMLMFYQWTGDKVQKFLLICILPAYPHTSAFFQVLIYFLHVLFTSFCTMFCPLSFYSPLCCLLYFSEALAGLELAT